MNVWTLAVGFGLGGLLKDLAAYGCNILIAKRRVREMAKQLTRDLQAEAPMDMAFDLQEGTE